MITAMETLQTLPLTLFITATHIKHTSLYRKPYIKYVRGQ